jgi:DNA-binding response OmpR family regulator
LVKDNRNERAMMKKILVVDDEENIRFLYQEELEEEGYTVDVAAHGQEALEKMDTFKPDLVTLDIRMPEMDGVETLRKIREFQRDLPVILCSAYGEYKQDLTTWASDAYVIKTSDLTELKGTIRTLLSKD